MLNIEKYETTIKDDHFIIHLYFKPENLNNVDYKGILFCLTGKKKISHILKPNKNLYTLNIKFMFEGDTQAFITELFRMSDNESQVVVHSLYNDELYSVWAQLLLRWIVI